MSETQKQTQGIKNIPEEEGPKKGDIEKLLEATKGQREVMAEAQAKIDTADPNAGMDKEFDIQALITEGIYSKKGIEVIPGKFWVDMHTLNKSESILAERLVDEHFFSKKKSNLGVRLSKDYAETGTVATLVMSVTRCNNAAFENPELEDDGSEDFKKKWESKGKLFSKFLKLPDTLVNSLLLIYVGLQNADVLVGDEQVKK